MDEASGSMSSVGKKERDQQNEQAIWNRRKYMQILPGKRQIDILNTVEFHNQTSNLILKWAMNLIISLRIKLSINVHSASLVVREM